MEHLTVREALPIFYKNYDLQSDGGVDESTVKIVLLPGISMYIPNFEARKKIVVKHDIHHLLTGYSASMKGETEISAWELSTGCHQNWVAFCINTYGMMLGVLFNLPGIYKAWQRGRHTSNIYKKNYKVTDLLTSNIGDLRTQLGLQQSQHKHSMSGLFSFIGFLLFGTIFSIASLILLPFALVYSLIIAIRN